MRHYPSIPYSTSNPAERYVQQLRLLEIAGKISEFGIRFNDAAAVEFRREAEWRQAFWTWHFCELTGLTETDLGKHGTGTTKKVRDYFWEQLKAPKLMIDKKTKQAQFNAPLLLEYTNVLPRDQGGEAALSLVAIRAAATSRRFLYTYRRFAELGGGRIFGGFNSLGTKGDRWSSSTRVWQEDAKKYLKLNMQNIPGKGFKFKPPKAWGDFMEGAQLQLADSLRTLFLPDEGCAWLKFDYDAQEARLLAYISKAAKLREWISMGKKADMHILNALSLFTELNMPADARKTNEEDLGRPLTQMEKTVNGARDAAKTALYAFSYQYAEDAATAMYVDTFKAWKKWNPKIEQKYVNKCAQRLFALHPELRGMQQTIRQQIDRDGMVQHPLHGGRIFLPAESRGYNIGINYLMQSGGGAVFAKALLRAAPQMSWQRGDSAILSLVHDEVNAQARLGDEPRVMSIIQDAMEEPFELYNERVNLPAEGSSGPNWGSLKKVKK